MSRYPPLPAL